MLNPRLAGRYAKSLIDLAVERNQLEQVHDDMQYMRALIKASSEFASLLRSPVVPVITKSKAITAVTNGKLTELSAAFINLLITKNREYFLVDIVEAAINQYNKIKGIHKVKLTTAVALTEEAKTAIVVKIKRDTTMEHILLETVVKDELIGGFILEFNNNLVDASIRRDLRDVKKQFDDNIYVKAMR